MMPPLSPETAPLVHSSFRSFDYKRLKAPLPLTKDVAVQRRNVNFAPSDMVFEIPHIDDLSEDEIDNVWMSPEDGSKIRQECQSIVVMMNNESENLKDIETRGLEQHAVAYTEQCTAIKHLLYEAVDRIQTFQAEKGVEVSHLIAELCQKISAVSVITAQRTATHDAMAIYEFAGAPFVEKPFH
jgi:hypothetical protein